MENVSARHVALFRRFSAVAALSVIAISLAVLVGYLLQNQALKSFSLPVAMNPTTAALFLLGGVDLLLLGWQKPPRLAVAAGIILSVLLCGLGALKVAGAVVDQDVYFDQVLFSDQLRQEALVTGRPNRVAPNTALGFSLVGLALLFLSFRKRERIAQGLASMTFSIAFLAILGYAYGVASLIGLSDYVPMAINTALAFALLSLGVLSVQADRGFMAITVGRSAGGAIVRRLIPVAILVPALLGYIDVAGERAGWYDRQTGLALLVLSDTVVFVVLLWMQSVRLHGLDAERQATADHLAEVSEKNELLLQSIGDGVIAVDRDWTITLWNASAERITGFLAAEATGKPFRDVVRLLFEGSRKENIRFIEDAMLFKEARTMENHTVLVRKDGSEIPVGDSAAPILDGRGTVVGAIIALRDATAERESHELKSDFAYAAHQLRTPVTKAIWAMESVLEGDYPRDVRERMETAFFALKSVVKLNNQILAVSQLDQGTVQPSLEETDLAEFLPAAVRPAEVYARSRNAAVALAPVPAGLTVMADRVLLTRILMEVTDNALYYGKPKSTVRVSAARKGSAAVIEVTNEGPGIPEKEKALIFTKFFRGSNIDTTKTVGAGLGLFIARAYAKILRGKIWFRSDQDGTTTFSISLPFNGK